MSDDLEAECPALDKPLATLVRPCERYKELHKSCSSIRNRVNQYYVYGETLDCSDHLKNYEACMKFRKTKDADHLDRIIDWEKNYINLRVQTVRQNKVWEPRDTPPSDFSDPLPRFIVERNKDSLFHAAGFDNKEQDINKK